MGCLKYPGPGSNRHDRNGHWILSPARLPIPPPGHPYFKSIKKERETGLGPATPTLARSCSTN
jgi:hypothetical protein